jgi:deazaflavin-dependent oxidoreductase (nitroreductase family)
MIARRLVVIHRGRTAGLLYRTPVTAFPYRDGFLIALTYGRDVDWVKNVIAEGGCRLIHRGRAVDLTGRGSSVKKTRPSRAGFEASCAS